MRTSLILTYIILITAVQIAVKAEIIRPVRSVTNSTAEKIKSALSISSRLGSPRIFGGSTGSRGQFPWHVGIIADNKFVCSGAFISQNWILTAAHCTKSYSVFEVIFGVSQNITSNSENGALMEITTNKVVHSGFNPRNYKNDIALLQLQTTIPTNDYIKPIALLSSADVNEISVGSTVTITGWGTITSNSSSLSVNLKSLEVSILDNALCAMDFGDNITQSKICTKSVNSGETPCKMDDGDPLVKKIKDTWTLIGIVSFVGPDCQQYPTANTNIINYLSWISANTNIKVS